MIEVGAAPGVDTLVGDLDALETYQGHDIAANLGRAQAIEQAADLAGETELGHRARLVQADMAQRNGDVGSAARVFLTVHRWALDHQRPALAARSHFHLALTHHYLGDQETSLEHAISSVELLGADTPPGLRVMHLIRLANALAESGVADAARERYRQAERIAITIGDFTRQMLLLNNLAYTEYEWDELDQAWAVVQRMRAAVRMLGRDFLVVERDTIANILIARGEYAAAVEAIGSVTEAPQWYEVHDLVDITLTLSTALRHLGRYDEARAAMTRCQDLCVERELVSVRVRALAEEAELYAATGDFRAAFDTLKLHHAEAGKLRSNQREAQARTRQAMFETAEARREAERYREQARQDALTGLWNRRYVNERLPALLSDAARTGVPITVAMVDLDYFKRINDTLSHDVGDRVLQTVAGLLSGMPLARHGDGFAARLGGEEFLVVQVGADADQITGLLEELRQTIRSYGWSPLTADLPVTVSVGAVSVPAVPAVDLTELLASADRNLYTAKASGRDRVVFSTMVVAV